MHVTHFWTLEGVGYADALFHSHLSVSVYYCWGNRSTKSGRYYGEDRNKTTV